MMTVTATIYCLGDRLRAFPHMARCLPAWGNCLTEGLTGQDRGVVRQGDSWHKEQLPP